MKKRSLASARTAIGLIVLSTTGPVLGTPIQNVCNTDRQTLESIQKSADQTLWSFMQVVCEGLIQVTETAPSKEELNKATPESESFQSVEPVQPLQPVHVEPTETGTERTNTIITGSNAQDSDPVSTNAITATLEYVEEVVSDGEGIEESRVSTVLDYEPSRYSKYSLAEQTPFIASSQPYALVLKPHIMSVTPHGLYSAFFWHHYEEPGYMRQRGRLWQSAMSTNVPFENGTLTREWDRASNLAMAGLIMKAQVA